MPKGTARKLIPTSHILNLYGARTYSERKLFLTPFVLSHRPALSYLLPVVLRTVVLCVIGATGNPNIGGPVVMCVSI